MPGLLLTKVVKSWYFYSYFHLTLALYTTTPQSLCKNMRVNRTTKVKLWHWPSFQIFKTHAPSPDLPKFRPFFFCTLRTSKASCDGASNKVKVTQGHFLLSPRYLHDWIKQLIYFSSNEFTEQPGATLIMVTSWETWSHGRLCSPFSM